MADADQSNLTMLTVDLLSAYVANNTIEHTAIPDLIRSTHAALRTIETPEPPVPEEPEYKSAVSIRQSLKSRDKIISLIDGKPYQTLKRHLKSHNLTPDEYRARYGLPKTYPMVAPAYSEARREIAKKLGLGNRVKGGRAQQPPAAPAVVAAAPTRTPTRTKTAAPKATKPAPAAVANIGPAATSAESSGKPAARARAKAAPRKAATEAAATAAAPKAAPKGNRTKPARPDGAPPAATGPGPRTRKPKQAPAAS